MARAVERARIPEELELARSLLENGELDEAQEIVDAVLIAGPEPRDLVDSYLLRGEILMERGELRLALLAFDTAEAADRRDPDVQAAKGEALFSLWQFERARDYLEKALRQRNRDPDLHRLMALALDRLGKRKLADLHFARAAKLDHERFSLPHRVDRAAFDRLARAAIESLPEEVKARLGAIGFLVEDYPALGMLAERPDDADPETLGVFYGVDLPHAALDGGLHFAPNHIHLFERNLENMVSSLEELDEEIRTTVYHEVGHYLGLDEDEVEELGLG